jgi:hypothetical protein
MPPYSWIHLENVWWVLAGGLVFAAAIVLARASTTFTFTFRKRSDKELDDEVHTFADDVAEQNRPVPILIWLVFIGYFVWAALYVVFSGVRGL